MTTATLSHKIFLQITAGALASAAFLKLNYLLSRFLLPNAQRTFTTQLSPKLSAHKNRTNVKR